MKKERVDKKVLRLTELSVLLAIILIMGFTPIGYLKIGIVEITLITVPVIIGAMVVEPRAGALLGFVFGMTSFLQCVFGMSAFGMALLEVNPWLCFLVCVPTRTLMGWLTGLFFKVIKKDNFFGYAITGFIGSALNTIFFVSALLIFYWQTEYIQGIASMFGTTGIVAFILAFVGINGLVELIACTILSSVICQALKKWFNS